MENMYEEHRIMMHKKKYEVYFGEGIDVNKVTFFKGTWHEDSEQYTNKQIVAVFNMNNIVGFRKIED